MRLSRRTAVGIVTGFLISASFAPAFAGSNDVQNEQRATNQDAVPCQPLSWEVANKLPWFIRASDVQCMNPTQDDLQASTRARNLLESAVARMQKNRPIAGSSIETEYNYGIDAYAQGRYIAAIDHFRAADPQLSVNLADQP